MNGRRYEAGDRIILGGGFRVLDAAAASAISGLPERCRARSVWFAY